MNSHNKFVLWQWIVRFQINGCVYFLTFCLEILQALASSYLHVQNFIVKNSLSLSLSLSLSHSLLTCCRVACLFRLLSLVGSENLKKVGANSTNHFRSMAVVSLMYSFVVSTSSWYITLRNKHSVKLLKNQIIFLQLLTNQVACWKVHWRDECTLSDCQRLFCSLLGGPGKNQIKEFSG